MFYIDEINSYLSRRERLRIKKKCKKWANNTTKRKKEKNMKIHFARSIDFSIRTFPELSGFIVHLPQTMLLLRHKMNDNLQLNLHNNFSSFYWALFFLVFALFLSFHLDDELLRTNFPHRGLCLTAQSSRELTMLVSIKNG